MRLSTIHESLISEMFTWDDFQVYLRPKSKANLHNMPGFVEMFSAMEGPGTTEHSMQNVESHYSIAAALKALVRSTDRLKNLVDGMDESDEDDVDWTIGQFESRFPIAEIYGNGGWNRYFVYPNGDVYFSAGHATMPGTLEKAKSLGFPIHGN